MMPSNSLLRKGLRILLIFCLLIAFNSQVSAQQDDLKGIKGVHFKDGTVVMGTILKMNEEQVVIKKSDDQLVVRKFNDIQKFVMAEENISQNKPSAAPSPAAEKVSLPQDAKKGNSDSASAEKIKTETVASAARQFKWFVAGGGGGGGEAKSGNLHFEGGGYSIDKPLNFLFVLGGAITFNRDETPDHVNDHPCAGASCVSLGTKKRGEEAGIYAKLGIEPVRNSGIFIFGKGGYATGKEIELAQSTLTGRYYEQSSTNKSYFLYGGGIGYYPKVGRLSLHLEYDNRMGFAGGAGFCW